jgi:dienelactone hydrolase
MPYDPFARGPYPVGGHTIHLFDSVRNRTFPCEIWYPATPESAGLDLVGQTRDSYAFVNGQRKQTAVRNAACNSENFPLIVFSHGSARGGRLQATYLTTHLSSHGYIVAAIDHFEVVATDLARKEGETEQQKKDRAQAWISNRVPDIRFLLDSLADQHAFPEANIDESRIGIIGYSLGGWTALSALETEMRIHAAVALAPGGSSQPKPGILPGNLTFQWKRNVPTLYVAAENDVMIPVNAVTELYNRTTSTKQMIILRNADHAHFLDHAEEEHEIARNMTWQGVLAWIPKEMKPIQQLCSGEDAHRFVRGHSVCHMDAFLKKRAEAQELLAAGLSSE